MEDYSEPCTKRALITRFGVECWPGESESSWDVFCGHPGNTACTKFETSSAKERVSRGRRGRNASWTPSGLSHSVYYVITRDRVSLVVGEQTTFTTDNHPSGCSDNSFRMDVLVEKHAKITALVEVT